MDEQTQGMAVVVSKVERFPHTQVLREGEITYCVGRDAFTGAVGIPSILRRRSFCRYWGRIELKCIWLSGYLKKREKDVVNHCLPYYSLHFFVEVVPCFLMLLNELLLDGCNDE